MESLKLEAEESKKTHLTTIELLSNKPLTVEQIAELFELLNARQVPYQLVKKHQQRLLSVYLASVLPAEEHFPSIPAPFSLGDKFVAERLQGS